MDRRAVPQTESNPVLSATVGWLRNLVGLSLAGLLFVLIFPRVSRRSVESLYTSPWASLGIGLALLIVVPVVAGLAVFLGALIGGWWIGLIILAAYFVAVALSIPIAGMSLGNWILERTGRPQSHLLLGVVVLMLVSAVPYIGGSGVSPTEQVQTGALERQARTCSSSGGMPESASLATPCIV